MKMTHHIFCAATLAVAMLSSCSGNKSASTTASADSTAATSVAFNADSAFAFVEKQCDFGERVPNSEAHSKCGDYIVAKFGQYGLSVIEQKADFTGWDGKTLKGRNIIASYNPTAAQRVVIASHWDSRPWADADADSANHKKPVMAANDGASGIAVMMEVARQIKTLAPKVGVDFVCFDAEDYGRPYWAGQSSDDKDWCLGSRYWSANPHVKGYKARYGILLDMVGGQNAQFCYEGFSMQYAQDIVAKVWAAAQTAGAGSFFPQKDGGYITDDHVPMNQIARIPTIDIIPYYEGDNSFGPTWHTTHDTPENISRETLKAVGQTIMQVLADEN